MITIITGTPGAGKTLYTVEKLLLPLVGTEVGGVPRRIFTNIKGLDAEHELIDSGSDDDQLKPPSKLWKLDKDDVWHFSGHPGGLRDWHLWAKPGDVIIYDEVQEVWKPRPNGAPVPPDIGKLETHRHMGVDFISITQGSALTERNLSMLGGRHLHVRRIGNLPFAIVYEWDSVSRSLLFSKALHKEKWRYNRATYKRYKSAQLHTKSPRRIPTLVWLLLFGVCATIAAGPQVYGRLADRFGWRPAEAAQVSNAPEIPGALSPFGGALPAVPAPLQPASAAVGVAPVFVGCARIKARCTCYDSALKQVEKDVEWCEHETFAHRPAQTALNALVVRDQELHVRALASDDNNGVLAFVGRRAELERAVAPPVKPSAAAKP